MHSTPALPTYTMLHAALKKSIGAIHAAEIHGLLCGFIAVNSAQQAVPWKKLTPSITGKKTLQILQNLYTASAHQLSEFSFEFSLLLPDDKTSIICRAESLGIWCQGFLTGLKFSSSNPIFSTDVNETINDL